MFRKLEVYFLNVYVCFLVARFWARVNESLRIVFWIRCVGSRSIFCPSRDLNISQCRMKGRTTVSLIETGGPSPCFEVKAVWIDLLWYDLTLHLAYQDGIRFRWVRRSPEEIIVKRKSWHNQKLRERSIAIKTELNRWIKFMMFILFFPDNGAFIYIFLTLGECRLYSPVMQ